MRQEVRFGLVLEACEFLMQNNIAPLGHWQLGTHARDKKIWLLATDLLSLMVNAPSEPHVRAVATVVHEALSREPVKPMNASIYRNYLRRDIEDLRKYSYGMISADRDRITWFAAVNLLRGMGIYPDEVLVSRIAETVYYALCDSHAVYRDVA